METKQEVFDYNEAICSGLSPLMTRRARNSEKSVSELCALLNQIRSSLLHHINQTKSLESLFNQQTFSSLLSVLQECNDGIKEPNPLNLLLNIVQLYLAIIPKKLRSAHFQEVFQKVSGKELEFSLDSSTRASLIFAIYSTVYPIVFTDALLKKKEEDLNAIEAVIQPILKDFVAALPQAARVRLEGLKLLQVVVLMKSRSVLDEEAAEDMKLEDIVASMEHCPFDQLGISLLPKNQNEDTRTTTLKYEEESQSLFRDFVRLSKQLSPALLTAWFNLLHPIIKTRPEFLSALIPILLNFSETLSSSSNDFKMASVQKRIILHTLKAELSTLMSVPRAEKFTSLIMEAFDKCHSLETSLLSGMTTATSTIKGKRKDLTSSSKTMDVDDEEEEREIAASLGGIQDRSERPSGAFAAEKATDRSEPADVQGHYELLHSEVLSRELLKIPGPLVIEMVLKMISSWTAEQILPVVTNRWPRKSTIEATDSTTSTTTATTTTASAATVKRSTEELFKLQAEPMTSELPGEIIHLSVARILQNLTDLMEYHGASRKDDLIGPLGGTRAEPEGTAEAGEATASAAAIIANSNSGGPANQRGIPIPLIPTFRILALVTAEVGPVRSDILMDPEARQRRLDRQLDPRQQRKLPSGTEASASKKQDIFGSDSEDSESEDYSDSAGKKSINQIILGWINESLPDRFDFVWYWLEAVWVREGKALGDGVNADRKMVDVEEDSKMQEDENSEYGKLFDDVVGLVGEYFIYDDNEASETGKEKQQKRSELPEASQLVRVLEVFLKLPRIRSSFIRNLLYPLIEESRYRSATLPVLARLILQRPGLRDVLTDLLMTLVAESEDSRLRQDTIEVLLLRGGLYPGLRSLSAQLEAFSLDLMDDLMKKQPSAVVIATEGGRPQTALEDASQESPVSLKRLKLASAEVLPEEAAAEAVTEPPTESLTDFDAETELFLGLLKRNPERLLQPLLVRFPQFSSKLQAVLLERSLGQVVQAWGPVELRAFLRLLREEGKVDEDGLVGELVFTLVNLILTNRERSDSHDADLVTFYDEFAEVLQTKIVAGTWDGRLIPYLLPWILRDRSDLPDFFSLFLPKLLAAIFSAVTANSSTAADSLFLAAAGKICTAAGGQLISPTQLFVQLHGNFTSTTPVKVQIDAIQAIFKQAKGGLTTAAKTTSTATAATTEQALFTPAIIATGLSQLIEAATLSPLLGRTLLQSYNLTPGAASTTGTAAGGPLTAQFLLGLLSRLVSRKIWENSRLWEGWIRCCRALLPGSLSLLLQLPSEQLERLLKESGADLKKPLKDYLYNQPPSVRKRYASVLASLERK